jgi:predicted TIM-barrel fold metal-dependent hydrolase
MTGQVKKSWQLAEQHGLWWAYEGDLPPPEALRKKILVDNPARLYEF